MSQEYIGAIVLLTGALLKVFGIEIENAVIEGILTFGISAWIAYRRHQKGDINILGGKL